VLLHQGSNRVARVLFEAFAMVLHLKATLSAGPSLHPLPPQAICKLAAHSGGIPANVSPSSSSSALLACLPVL
jgi:hypothetical protein